MDNQTSSIREMLRAGRKEAELTMTSGKSPSASAKTIMNDVIMVTLVIIAALVSFTDFSFTMISFRNITAVTIFLYIITTAIYRNQYTKGKIRGREDEAFKAVVKEYETERQRVYDTNVTDRIPEFCIWYSHKELEDYKTNLLLTINMHYEEYLEKYEKMDNKAIMKLKNLTKRHKKILIKCNNAKPIFLNQANMLTDSGSASRGKILSESGEHRETRDKTFNLIYRALTAAFAGFCVINLMMDFTWQNVVQWAIRMMPIFTTIIMAEDAGFCNITVTEMKFKKTQVSLLNLYHEYLEKHPKEEYNSTAVNDADKPSEE